MSLSMYSIFLLKVQEYSTIVIKRIKLRDVADLSIDKVHYCYFQRNLQVIDMKDPEITTGP